VQTMSISGNSRLLPMVLSSHPRKTVQTPDTEHIIICLEDHRKEKFL